MSDVVFGLLVGGVIGIAMTVAWVIWLIRNPENWWPRR